MLFYLFCMFDDYEGTSHRNPESARKSVIKTPYLRSSFSDENHRQVPIIPDDGGSQKKEPRWVLRGPHNLVARMDPPAREQGVWLPWPTGVDPLSRTSSPRNPKT